ncbi:MAG: YciI family protein [Mesorhizobium sp.]|nr:YciI family protein [Mesorhizobium sp.]MCO5163680.1 YciI family protein [Mesorhizobium sp.]
MKLNKAAMLNMSKDMLAKELYLVLWKPIAGIEVILKNVEQHLAYQRQLGTDGVIFAAGPVFDDEDGDWQGAGLNILRAASQEEAAKIAAQDPMYKAGARSFEVRPWIVNEGSITVRLDFAKKAFALT